MRPLRPSTDDEMIATFLRQELNSSRFGPTIRDLIGRAGLPESIVSHPDLTDADSNTHRRGLLGLHRGYGAREGYYLAGFPTTEVQWVWWALTPNELCAVKYIAWDYWLELSGGTRRPADAADRIRSGVRPYNVSNDGYLVLAAAVRAGARLPELILVTADDGSNLVVLEGHARLTAYALARDALVGEIHALVGSSPAIARWGCY